jgi:hypothetical protein
MPQDAELEVKEKAERQHCLNQDHVKPGSSDNRQGYMEGLTVIDTAPNLPSGPLNTLDLAIPIELAASLPQSVCNQLATMPKHEQDAFLKAFQDRSASLVMAYLTSLIYGHYVLLGRWAMSGWMWLSLFTASTVGVIWWLIDLVRMPRMVREHNERVAAEILQTLRMPPAGPSPLARS